MTMTLPVQGGRDFARVPPGMHVAICTLLADCGLQPGSSVFPKPKHKLYIRFEVPELRIEYEREGVATEGPQAIGSWYVASMHPKATLRQHLEGWRGRKFSDEEAGAFDLESILGKACTLLVQESESGGKTYSNIRAIGPAPKGITYKAENPLLFYGPDSGPSALAALPAWLRTKIETQVQPEPEPDPDSMHGDAELPDVSPFVDDDIPF